MKFFHLTMLLSLLATSFLSAKADNYHCFYVRAEAGASFSTCADISANPIVWDAATEGYDARLGTAPVFGLGFGYNVCDYFACGVSVSQRTGYKYCKRQTSTGSNTPGFLGNKVRYFNLDNTTFMTNFFVKSTNGEGCLAYTFGCLSLLPYAGIGLGLANNRVYNFHSVREETIITNGFTTPIVASIMTDRSVHQFAWQAELGIDFSLCDSVFFGVGYRFFDGGKFASNNYLVDTSEDIPSPIVAPAWCSRLKANEIVVNFSIGF